jgi:hypothetical protein
MNSQEVSPTKKQADLLTIFRNSEYFNMLPFKAKMTRLEHLKCSKPIDYHPFNENEYADWVWQKMHKGGQYANDVFLLLCIGANKNFATWIFENVLGGSTDNYFHPTNDGYYKLQGSSGLGVWFNNHVITREYPGCEAFLKRNKIVDYGICPNWIKFILAVHKSEHQRDILKMLKLE